jgi:hypothetical protein
MVGGVKRYNIIVMDKSSMRGIDYYCMEYNICITVFCLEEIESAAIKN